MLIEKNHYFFLKQSSIIQQELNVLTVASDEYDSKLISWWKIPTQKIGLDKHDQFLSYSKEF